MYRLSGKYGSLILLKPSGRVQVFIAYPPSRDFLLIVRRHIDWTTGWKTEESWVGSRQNQGFSCSQNIQRISEAYQASHSVDTGVKRAGRVANHSLLRPKLEMVRAVAPFPRILSWRVQRLLYLFTFVYRIELQVTLSYSRGKCMVCFTNNMLRFDWIDAVWIRQHLRT